MSQNQMIRSRKFVVLSWSTSPPLSCVKDGAYENNNIKSIAKWNRNALKLKPNPNLCSRGETYESWNKWQSYQGIPFSIILLVISWTGMVQWYPAYKFMYQCWDITVEIAACRQMFSSFRTRFLSSIQLFHSSSLIFEYESQQPTSIWVGKFTSYVLGVLISHESINWLPILVLTSNTSIANVSKHRKVSVQNQ